MLTFQNSYRWVLAATVLANLMLFFPFWGWPNIFTGLGMLFSSVYLVFFIMRIGKMQSSGAKYFLRFLCGLLIISFLAFSVFTLLTLYSHVTDPRISEDDLASLDWILPLMLQSLYVMVLAVVCVSEAILLSKYTVDGSSSRSLSLSPAMAIGVVCLLLWALDVFFLRRLGFWSYGFFGIGLGMFLVLIVRNGKG